MIPAIESVLVTLDLPPLSNRYWRVYHGKPTLSDEARSYKDYVRTTLHAYEPFAGPVAVTVTVYRKQKSGDLDNFLKVLFDSLQGCLYTNDKQIVAIHAYRDDDKHNPRVVVCVEQLPAAVKQPARRGRKAAA